MITVRRTTITRTIFVLALFAARAEADERAQTADAHFRAGVSAYQQRTWDLAVREFEAAYEASPHYAVLYNLGLAYAALGRPVDAVETLQKYLSEGGTHIPAERQEIVRAAITENEKRLGALALTVTPNTADVSIDGRRTNVTKPVRLPVGMHTIVVEAPDRTMEKKTVEIRSGGREELHISLSPKASAQGTAAALRLSCPVPGVKVDIDDRSALRTARIIPIASGTHHIVFSREGYATVEQELSLEPGDVRDVACSMRVQKDFPERRMARFDVHPSQSPAKVTVDGAPYRNERIPLGIHRVAVSCDECVAWSREVNLEPGKTRRVDADLELLPFARERHERDHIRRRTWTWITGGTGLALGITSVVLFAVNQGHANEWQAEGNRLAAELSAADPPSQALVVESLAHDNEALSIQRTADIALGTAIVGGALLGIATYLYFTDKSETATRRGSSKQAIQQWPAFVW